MGITAKSVNDPHPSLLIKTPTPMFDLVGRTWEGVEKNLEKKENDSS